MGYKIIRLIVVLLTHVHMTIGHMLDGSIQLLKNVRQKKKTIKSLLRHLNVRSTQKLKYIYFMHYIDTIYVYVIRFFILFLDI